jgi:hypothetical protein
MSRYLFTLPPLTGHINPTAAVGAELARRGHHVAWAGRPGTLEPLLPPSAPTSTPSSMTPSRPGCVRRARNGWRYAASRR